MLDCAQARRLCYFARHLQAPCLNDSEPKASHVYSYRCDADIDLRTEYMRDAYAVCEWAIFI